MTGFQLKSAWGFSGSWKPYSNMSSYTALRKEIVMGNVQPWPWINFFFGTSFAGTQRTITLASSFGGVTDLTIMSRRFR